MADARRMPARRVVMAVALAAVAASAGRARADNGNPGNFLGSLWGAGVEQRAVPCPFLEYRVISVVGARTQLRVLVVASGPFSRADDSDSASGQRAQAVPSACSKREMRTPFRGSRRR